METSYSDTLFNFIGKTVDITSEDKQHIQDLITIESYDKHTVIIQQEQVCRHLRFVVSGVYRVYRIENGKEITSYFNYKSRNPFVASFISLLTGVPSQEIVECILPGALLSIPYEDWKSLYDISPTLNTYGRRMAEYNYVLAMERIESLQYKSASDRYDSFMKLYPTLLNLIPHHYIASYIGITPESLSRIRKQS